MSEISKHNRLGVGRYRKGAGSARRAATHPITVLHIDDDPNDTELLRAATRRAKAQFNLINVGDGDEAMAYLNGVGVYADRGSYPMPGLILLDLKMPRATGLEILKWIREHPECGRLPVVVLSGSELHEDIRQAYEKGANSYLVKPLGFEDLVALVKDVNAVWLPTERTIQRQQPS
jgi:CheY-like chemotaxis protein